MEFGFCALDSRFSPLWVSAGCKGANFIESRILGLTIK